MRHGKSGVQRGFLAIQCLAHCWCSGDYLRTKVSSPVPSHWKIKPAWTQASGLVSRPSAFSAEPRPGWREVGGPGPLLALDTRLLLQFSLHPEARVSQTEALGPRAAQPSSHGGRRRPRPRLPSPPGEDSHAGRKMRMPLSCARPARVSKPQPSP